MDILSKIPFLKDAGDDVEGFLSDEEIKKQNIKFHRDRVRNGPTKFKAPTSGQERRARQRALDGRTRKARRRQVESYFAAQAEAATLRGQLQAAGLIEYATDFQPAPQMSLNSIVWVLQRFSEGDDKGKVDVTYSTTIAALQSALNRYQSLVGEPQTLIPLEYVLPVAVAA